MLDPPKRFKNYLGKLSEFKKGVFEGRYGLRDLV
jgi:hypothetical protein